MKHYNEKIANNHVLRLTEYHIIDKHDIRKSDLYDKNGEVNSEYKKEFDSIWSSYKLEYTELKEYEEEFIKERDDMRHKYSELIYISDLNKDETRNCKYIYSLERKIGLQRQDINKLENTNKGVSKEIDVLKTKRIKIRQCAEDLKIIKCYITDDKIKKLCDSIISKIK